MRDWTPMVGYGDINLVNANTTLYQVLYPLPDFAAGDAEFLVEDEEETGMLLERIVGDVTWSWQEEPTFGRAFWRLLPMGVNYDMLTVLEPFTPSLEPDSSEWANIRWWAERDYRVDEVGHVPAMPSGVDHPYWTRVDINPRQQMGSRRNLWPVIAYSNFTEPAMGARAQVRHRLRAYWKY